MTHHRPSLPLSLGPSRATAPELAGLAERPAKPTRVDAIRTRLADDIVQGRLAPGCALEEAHLSEVFGVSRTPVREALRQLEAMGLARPRPRRGTVVALITPERLDEMFAVMGELEAICARDAAQRMPEAARLALRSLHESGALLVEAGDHAAYMALNQRFHDALYCGSGNAFLAEMAQSVRSRVAPFRQAQFHAPGRLRQSHAEHARIVKAILAADAEAAMQAMREHVSLVRHSFNALRPQGAAAASEPARTAIPA